jgi:CubicO group peptidase (beta-lactamase class C family)
MAKRWNRIETWIGLIVLAVGALLAAILGLHTYMRLTATPLHPDPPAVPSVSNAAPPANWIGSVEQARRDLRTALAERNLPGLSVAVGVDGSIVWAEGFGWADIESRTPVSPNHRFRIGDASIPLTSAAIGLLLEQNKVNLDDEIQKYVPEFPTKPWPVTVRHVMGHLAGIRTDGGDEGPLFTQHCERPAEGLQPFADRALLFEPGTRYRYSRYSWILASAAIERAAGEPFLAYLQKHVFDPLAMSGTVPDSTSEIIRDRTTSYFPRYAGDPRYGEDLTRDIDLSCYAGSSVFLSTPSDLVRFAMAVNGGKLLQPATAQLLQSPQRLPSGEETGYGLGWDLEQVTLAEKPVTVVGHDGDVLGGMVASLMVLRERGLVVAVTSNISYSDTAELARRVMEAFGSQSLVVSRQSRVVSPSPSR